MDKQPVSFPQWKQVLEQTGFPPRQKAAYTREIITFLKHCKTHRAPAAPELMRQYLRPAEGGLMRRASTFAQGFGLTGERARSISPDRFP